jgi:tetratricopeptide (TPR) repeat protein
MSPSSKKPNCLITDRMLAAVFFPILVTLALESVVRPAAAQGVGANHEGGNNSYRYQCNSSAPAVAIIACTKIIEDKHEAADDRAMALQNRGFYYQHKGDLDRSIADYTTVLTFPSTRNTRAKIYLNLGVLHLQKRDEAAALDNYNEAVRLDPKLPSAYINRASIFIKRDDIEDAIADLDRATLLSPKDGSSPSSTPTSTWHSASAVLDLANPSSATSASRNSTLPAALSGSRSNAIFTSQRPSQSRPTPTAPASIAASSPDPPLSRRPSGRRFFPGRLHFFSRAGRGSLNRGPSHFPCSVYYADDTVATTASESE